MKLGTSHSPQLPSGHKINEVRNQTRLSTKINWSLLSLEKHMLSYLIIAMIASNVVDARKTFLVKQQHPALYAPRVQSYDTSFKFFDIKNGNERYRMVVDNQV